MSAYTQPIIRFGLVTPTVFNCFLLGGVLFAVSKLSEIRNEKETLYQAETERLAKVKALEEEIRPKKKSFEAQKRLLQADPGQTFTRLVDTFLPKYKEIELERSGLVFPLERGRIANQMKAEVARVKSSFQGGMGPFQEALLQVESLMPQAMLEELKLSRKTDSLIGEREFLWLEMTHTCWKAGDEKP